MRNLEGVKATKGEKCSIGYLQCVALALKNGLIIITRV
jgi:hypothetical protein